MWEGLGKWDLEEGSESKEETPVSSPALFRAAPRESQEQVQPPQLRSGALTGRPWGLLPCEAAALLARRAAFRRRAGCGAEETKDAVRPQVPWSYQSWV